MERVAIDGLELEYELIGSGEPVVLVHWGLCAWWAQPLLAEPALADRFALLRYHRAGFAESDGVPGPIGLAEHAAHCARLLGGLGIERAHVVGHSSSADIALQLALDHPESVQSLVLMEAARPVPPTDDQRPSSVSSWRLRYSVIATATGPARSTRSPTAFSASGTATR